MFNSIHSQRWFKWVCQPKKYLVNIEVKIGDKYTFRDVEVVAHTKYEAKQKAIMQTKSEIQVITKGLRSFGRAKKFEEQLCQCEDAPIKHFINNWCDDCQKHIV